uniref:Uncharacterized protein n=1 Tax=Urocitellus parryii TaxID=9999 RepID=A0A8D2HLQ5_UROPR
LSSGKSARYNRFSLGGLPIFPPQTSALGPEWKQPLDPLFRLSPPSGKPMGPVLTSSKQHRRTPSSSSTLAYSPRDEEDRWGSSPDRTAASPSAGPPWAA